MTAKRPLLDALVGDEEIETRLGDEAQIAAMVRFEIALAEAEATSGLISAEAADAIVRGLAGFTPDWDDLARGLARDGVVVPALVSQLRRGIAAPHAEALHKGATSQDVIDTALVLQLSAIVAVYEARIEALLDGFEALGKQYGSQQLMAHTRMQRALPFTVADKLATWATPLQRALQEIRASRSSLLVIQLGGPVGDRASFGGTGEAVARALAQQLDLGLAEPWHSARDQLVGFASLLSLLTGTLGKFGADVALLAQNEVGDVVIAGGGGSSAMAHKSNPVNAEVLVALARYNAGLVGTLHQAMVHENERSGAAWTLEWLTLPAMLKTSGASLRLAQVLIGQMSFPAK